jgi:hypothetical protein
MLTGAADLYNHIAAEFREEASSEILSALDRFTKPSSLPGSGQSSQPT